MMPPYVLIPLAVYIGLDNHSITPEQFDIFSYCYRHASRPDYCVHGYSAENICLFRGLDANQANVKKYRRAAADMKRRYLLQSDYRHIDPTRSEKSGRPYNVWVPNPGRFVVIGTHEENRLSLWRQFVPLVVPDNVPLPDNGNVVKSISSQDAQTDNVPLNVPLPVQIVSVTNQENPKTTEKEPLNPPSGDFSPAPLPPGGERSDAAGLENPHRKVKSVAGKENPLNAKQCARLRSVSLLYADFTTWLYQNEFSPDIEHVQALLRDFHPVELLVAQTNRFSYTEHVPKKTMAHFFYKSARDGILAARIKGLSARPKYGVVDQHGVKHSIFAPEGLEWLRGKDAPKQFLSRWRAVIAAWNEYKGLT